jgi:hypothetical protein
MCCNFNYVINQKLIAMAQEQKKPNQKQDSAKKSDQKSDQKTGKQQHSKK